MLYNKKSYFTMARFAFHV